MNRFLTPREFAETAGADNARDIVIRAGGERMADVPPNGERMVRYVLSTSAVARDGHTIATDGWMLDNYRANPVFLWAHLDDEPPIGRMVEIGVENSRLVGTVQYVDRDIYPFADTIYRLTEAGYLNAVSVSWLPLEWKFAKGPDRDGGIDFLRQDLLEVSAVPVPALPTALATARSAGIDTAPLYEWCGRVLDGGGMLLVPRAEIEQLRKAAKMTVRSKSKNRAPKAGKRGLWACGYLAQLLQELGYLQQDAEWEAALEEDNSLVPGMLMESLKSLGAALIAMTQEEVGELLHDDDDDDVDVEIEGDAYVAAAKTDAARTLRRLVIAARKSPAPAPRVRHYIEYAGGIPVTEAEVIRRDFAAWLKDPTLPLMLPDTVVIRALGAPKRAGRVLSADNERCLREAMEHHEAGGSLIRSVLDQCDDPKDDPDDEDDPEDEASRLLRVREALKIKAAVPA